MMGFTSKCALVRPFILRAAPGFPCAVLLSSVLAGFVSRAENAGKDAFETRCAAQKTDVLTVRLDQRTPAFLTHANTQLKLIIK